MSKCKDTKRITKRRARVAFDDVGIWIYKKKRYIYNNADCFTPKILQKVTRQIDSIVSARIKVTHTQGVISIKVRLMCLTHDGEALLRRT